MSLSTIHPYTSYVLPQVPYTSYVLPQVPTHNPSPVYRETLLTVLKDSYDDAERIQKCLSVSPMEHRKKLNELIKINKEAKQRLIEDGYKGFSGGRRRKQTRRRRQSTRRRIGHHSKFTRYGSRV